MSDPGTDASQTPPLLRLPAEIRNTIYGYALEGSEKPLFFVENHDVWRCGESPAFMRPGPPSLLLVNRQIAEEASQILHEVREFRLAVISQGFPTGRMSCFHRFCSLEAFTPVFELIQKLTLQVHAHPGHRVDQPYLKQLDWLCTLLEQRTVPIRQLGMVITCCSNDSLRACRNDVYNLVQRFQELQPTLVEHAPWNAKCLWAKIRETEGRYRRAAVSPEVQQTRIFLQSTVSNEEYRWYGWIS